MDKINALKRLREEYRILNINPIKNICCTIGLVEEENMLKWRASLCGPKDTSYKGGIFFIELDFPDDFPKRPPSIYFLTPIYHLNINYKKPERQGYEPLGNVSVSFVNRWNPLTTIREILIKLFTVFYLTNPEGPYGLERANEFKYNRTLYEEKVRYFTKKYASPMDSGKLKLFADKDWDFSYSENCDLKQINSETNITFSNKTINHYENNALINLRFDDDSYNKSVFIECKTNEITENVIQRFKCKKRFNDSKNFLFIFNGQQLNLSLSIRDNGLKNEDDILCICIPDILFSI